jgi:hypothetical protein
MTPSVWEVTVTGSGRTFLLVAALLLPITGAVGCAPMTQFVTPAPAAGPAAVAGAHGSGRPGEASVSAAAGRGHECFLARTTAATRELSGPQSRV